MGMSGPGEADIIARAEIPNPDRPISRSRNEIPEGSGLRIPDLEWYVLCLSQKIWECSWIGLV